MSTRSTILLGVFLFLTSNVFAQQFSVTFNVSDGTNDLDLVVGIDPEGSTDYVEDLDQYAPPAPPSGAFDARLSVGGEDYIEKYQANSISEKEFEFGYAPETGASPITITWNNSVLADYGTFTIQDRFGGSIVDVDLASLDGEFVPEEYNSVLEEGFVLIVVPAEVAEEVLEITPETVDFGTSGGDESVSITSNVSWNVSESLDWLSVDPVSGSNDGSITLTATENGNTVERSGDVTISGTDSTRVISVTQAAVDSVLNVQPTSLNFSASAGTETFSVTSNIDWTVNDDADWITVSDASGTGDDGSVNVTVLENESTNERSGTVTVESGSLSQTISVTQDGFVPEALELSTETVDFVNSGGDESVSITSNVSWTVSESLDWLSVDPVSGSNDGSITLTATENEITEERTGNVTVSGIDSVRTITVTQEAADSVLSVSPTSMDFTSSGGSKTFSVTSNLDWSVTASDSWISVTDASGSGDDSEVTITVENNEVTEARTGSVTISAGDLSSVIAINQEALFIEELDISPNSLSFSGDGEENTVTVTANVDWEVSNELDWVTINPVSSSGNNEFTVTASENPTIEERSGEITVNGIDSLRTISILQSEGDSLLQVSTTELNFEVSGGSSSFNINSNLDWTIQTDDSWISLSSESGSGDLNGISVTVEENNTGDERNGTVDVTAGNLSITITVVQEINSPPTFTMTLPDTTVDEGETLEFTYGAEDIDGDALSYSIGEGSPEGATIDAETGEFSIELDFEAAGEHTIVVEVTDGTETISTSATLTVNDVNRAPEFVATLPDTTIQEGETLAFSYQAEDADGDGLTYGLEEGPDGSAIDAETGAFSWEAGFESAGEYTITVSVTDGSLIVEESSTLIVGDVEESSISDVKSASPGTIVNISGVVTTPDFGEGKASFFIQDGASGIFIEGRSSASKQSIQTVEPGQEITVVGEVEMFENQRKIMLDSYEVLSEESSVPDPVKITSSGQWSLESDLFGARVELENVTLVDPSQWPEENLDPGTGINIIVQGNNQNLEEMEFTIRINSGVSELDGSETPEGPFSVRGVLTSFNGELVLLPFFLDELGVPTSIEENLLPSEFLLMNNYPNPFNPTTQIEYRLPMASEIIFRVFDITGKEVYSEIKPHQSAGIHTISFDASKFSSGIYIYQLKAGDFVDTKKMTLIK